ncbi:MAG: hypothetical protein R3209_00060 [Salinimicrobium sediminis]|uniref:Uncharacterized protein n=1 Tax=Salinimicrobium sediminis TaxID=1343891 RepID=A0A285X3W3_9FLAO|nr:hypothetical protein [Salinimicrobium sediminis]MDX1601435.1 hypothetical protein [Salinimicrobium sediminis]MDX1753360.1 hypothetical protein [Salinimicrobium sediminis]SOC79069.1 hypothetical protein SAMN06296241_0589 [Salinimicrobium sediminis]
MKKRLFFGFAFFVGLALMVAWQFAAAELADLQKNVNPSLKKHNVEVADAGAEQNLFI